jgi:DNA-binding NtrC family response regulator
MNPGYILVVDDEPDIRRTVAEILADEHYKVVTAESAAAAREAWKRQRPDLVLLDIWMPDTDGITLLKEWSRSGDRGTPVVMMSGHGTVETAIEATRHGAYDFIEKPVSMGKLLVTVERALEAGTLKRDNVQLQRQVEPASILVGKSAAMTGLRQDIERVAATDTWVLISGEPGSGKAVAARYLHAHSPRHDGPFVEMSLAAIPPQNVPLQLFGDEQGEVVTPGSLEQANGGTLVLNEIADLDASTQAQLLNALESRRLRRLNGRETLELDLRVITLSSQDLRPAVTEGRFREDLYYRLNVVPLAMPSLRARREDVPELVNFYLNWLVDHEQLAYRKFSTAALNVLRNYPWPGNIRELKNLVQRLLIMNRGEEVSEDEVEQALGAAPAPTSMAGAHTFFNQQLREARDQFEKEYLEYHLARTGGNVAEVAKLSGMERTHLYRKLKQLGINPKLLKE